MTFSIRPAQPEDAPAIAHVHVESWRTTYKDLMPDEILANLSAERRETYWRGVISNAEAADFVYVAETDDGRVVGFASGGPERDNHPVYKGELYAIYLLQAYQGQGIGRAMAAQVARKLVDGGLTNMLVWVLTGNAACHFYEALGGKEVGRKPLNLNDEKFEEIGYGYDDIRPLAQV
jgi:ribosomal protein S18 acetylase RimI-like enzyme